ncbi:MAG: hypothetical protein ACK5AZ_07875 [Bryobacteraceae bacterium]
MPSQLAQTEIVSQAELRRRIALKLQIARLQRQLDDVDETIYLKLKSGARVEPGTHTATIERVRNGRTRIERVRVR